MEDRSYMNEGMDIRKYLLCLWGRIPLVLGAAALCAALGGLVCLAARTVPPSKREYQAFAKIYLDFAADETGEVYQAYNGYTWNDLMRADPIMELILIRLPEGYAREEAAEAIRAEILSDIRLLTVTVTTNQRERTDQILTAAVEALAAYGAEAKEFLEIRAIQKTEAALVTVDLRLFQAISLGGFLGLLLSLFCFSIYAAYDDRILTAGDLAKVTELRFLGYTDSEDVLTSDFKRNYESLQAQAGTLSLCEIARGKSLSAEEIADLKKAAGVVVSVPFGKVHGVWLSYALGQLSGEGCKLCGVAICEGGGKFLRRYYGMVKK